MLTLNTHFDKYVIFQNLNQRNRFLQLNVQHNWNWNFFERFWKYLPVCLTPCTFGQVPQFIYNIHFFVRCVILFVISTYLLRLLFILKVMFKLMFFFKKEFKFRTIKNVVTKSYPFRYFYVVKLMPYWLEYLWNVFFSFYISCYLLQYSVTYFSFFHSVCNLCATFMSIYMCRKTYVCISYFKSGVSLSIREIQATLIFCTCGLINFQNKLPYPCVYIRK